ncbi:MAG: hypothetical protein ACI38U_10920 [Corynebacterium sp.]|jgi:hypothetical protein|uniref:hypothetical protein n=1 Tax=unclassified Corynebacterium TaxID=2624378 RepID=UPI00095F683E|nr:hypothetical protein [Corynebacterium sp. CNJ-954]OLT55914.1 hypothetical protein BJF89_14150 [Corynebacterium sp. CNJ-954]
MNSAVGAGHVSPVSLSPRVRRTLLRCRACGSSGFFTTPHLNLGRDSVEAMIPGRSVGRKSPATPTVVVVAEAPDAMILVTDDGGGRDDLSASVPQLTSAIDERKQ